MIKTVLTVMLAFLVAFTCEVTSAADIYVPDDHTKIQWAVNNATAGDTILVRDGSYTENVDVNIAHLTIRSQNGDGSTYVQALNSNDYVFEVTADWVNISGFYVSGATGSWKAGFYLGNGVGHGNISDNAVSNNHNGIYLNSSDNNSLLYNTVNSNGYGIYLDDASNNSLSYNTANSNHDGFYLRSSSNNNSLLYNSANGNDWYGIYLYYSSNNSLTDSIANENGYGIYLDDSSNNNSLSDNSANGNDWYGIFMSSSSNSTLTSNTANGNNDGFYLRSSSNYNMLTDNSANENHGFGIILYYSSNNSLSYNIANSNDNSGIFMSSSSNNSLTYNTANENDWYGILLFDANNNSLMNNIANSNHDGFYLRSSSNYNMLTDNSANENHGFGIILHYSSNNSLTDNSASNNFDYDFYSDQKSHNNTIEDTQISSYPTLISFSYDNGVLIKGVDTAPDSPPAGKVNLSKYVNATNVTADSWLFLNVSYDESDVPDGVQESSLRMWKYNEPDWTEVTGTNGVNTTGNYVYANITSFSIFAPFGDSPAEAVPNITSYSPETPVNDTVCTWRTFNVTVNQTVNVSWYLNELFLFTNVSVNEANCSLHVEVVKVHNVSAIAQNGNGTDMQVWVWNVTASGLCGDVNMDGTVNVLDVLGVYRRALDPSYPLELPWAADVNCDGNINVLDVLGVYRRALDPGYDLGCCYG